MLLINELIFLKNEGIVINTENGVQRVYFALALLSGDNLGLNCLFGLHESFNSNHYCRFCREHKDQMEKQLKENNTMIRNKKNYEADLLNLQNGIKQGCFFHDIPNFHLTVNLYGDLMHDLFEGIWRYELPLILKHIVENKNNLLSLDMLNDRIKYFNFGSCSSNNTFPKFTQANLATGYYTCTSSEMRVLVTTLNLIIGDIVPESNKYWNLYLSLRKITCILTNNDFDEESIKKLETLISEHHQSYLNLFVAQHLLPKFHFMIHYPRIIRTIGPMWPVSCIRYEGKHKDFKSYATVCRSRINVCYSLALKNQLMLCERFVGRRGFSTRICKSPSIIIKLDDIKEYNFSSTDTGENLSKINSFQSAKWIEINGIKYNLKTILNISDVTDRDEFAEVKYILIGDDVKVFFICQKLKIIMNITKLTILNQTLNGAV
ncbi:uncharacterized protein [Chelonus insularis]|uniref:uncharacterized protein n=1 Tax=Chelonus insularis TaxID=460826 RepID=UPI00158D44C4|nr:uncharacterized protein LOC118074263 [Chelonus insularis]